MPEDDNPNQRKEAEASERAPPREEEEGVLSKLTDLFSRLSPFPSEPEIGEEVRRDLSVESLAVEISGKPLESYQVDQGEVFIHKKGGTGYYQVSEPPLSKREREVYEALLQDFFYSLRLEEAEEPMDYIEGAVWDSAYDLGFLDEVRQSFSKYLYYLRRNALGYGRIHIPMEDPRVEEVSLVSADEPVRVLHRDYADLGWLETNIKFDSEMRLRRFNERLAQRTGESLTAAAPITDSTTGEGHRIALTFGREVTFPGSAFTIRKHPQEPLTLPFLVGNNTLSSKMAAYLWQILEWKGYLNVVGPIGSGKTTLMNAVLGSVDPSAKRITIEETPEIRLPPENWESMHTRTAHFAMGEEYDVSLFDLVKTAMRHRPDYLTVGESRGREMRVLTHAASLGHSCASTFHSKSPEDALTRMRADPINLADGEILLLWCIPLTKQTTLPATGEVVRRVHTIKEVVPDEQGAPQLEEVFQYHPKTDSFEPSSLEEVVEGSYRLKEEGDLRGMSEDSIAEKLKEKADLLEDLVEKEKTSFREFTEKVRDFYS